jgi:hypothetical protein
MAVSLAIRGFGFEESEKKLHRLQEKVQKKIVSGALRKEARRAKQRIAENIKRLNLIDSGMLLAGYEAAPIKSQGKPGLIRVGVVNPTREALGIDPDDKYYYPYAVEFGHAGADAKPFIRPAIDNHKRESYRQIGGDIGKSIEREALK